MAKRVQDVAANFIIRHAQAHSRFLCLQNFRHLLAGFQYKSKRSWQVAFERAVQWRSNAFGIIRKVAQVAANERKLGFLWIHLFDAAYFFNCFVLKNVASNAINGIGWVDDNAAVQQAFAHLFYKPRLRIFRMYVDEHNAAKIMKAPLFTVLLRGL